MNMKIGVFGDSYAEHPAQNPEYLQWWQYVQHINPNVEIDNYGVAGSSLYYTWKKFQENHHKYDKVIVCLTSPNRLWLPHLPEDWKLEHVHNLYVMDNRVFKCASSIIDNMKRALTSYYKYIVNVEEQQDIHLLQITDIKRTRPDGLYLNSFCNLGDHSEYIPLHHISKLDGDLLGARRDIRANHFNDKSCRLFAAKIESWIQTSQFSLNIEEFNEQDIEK